MEIIDLEKMRVRDLIVYYLRNEKKEHTARRDEIIEFVRSSQPSKEQPTQTHQQW